MSNQLAEALRLMLEDARHDRVNVENFNKAAEALAAHEAAKPAEPVAWLYDVDGVIAVELRQNDRYWQNQFAGYVKGQPLYAAPVAVASPLSDEGANERIANAQWESWKHRGLDLTPLEFFRLGEQAHGIKEQQHE